MKKTITSFILGVASAFLIPISAEAEKSRPNILILYADDLGFGDLTSYNADSKIPTPHLDQLAAEGIRFTDGHSSSGICTPSRYALLTGRHHWRKGHGIVDSFGRSWFKAERLTLPEMLKEKGYHTAAIGKWHLGWNWNAVVKPGAVKVVVGRRKTYRPEDIDWSKPIPDGPLAHGFDHKFDHWSSQPFRGLKRDVYEGGHRVPFIVKWPGVTKAGTVSDALVSQIDIMATIADFVGYKLPDDQAEDSHNLAPLLRGDVDAVRTTHIHNTTNTQYAIRHGDWVLIDAKEGYSKAHDEAEAWEEKHGYPDDDDQPAELFNLVEDIGQRNNLAAEHPERVVELQSLLKQIREQGYSAPRLAK